MKTTRAVKLTIAYCFRNGVIKFGRRIPKGALMIHGGEAVSLRNAIFGIARESYPSKPGLKDSVPLVPGIPEAKDEAEAAKALGMFVVRIRARMNPAIRAIEAARRNRSAFPEPIVLPLLRNDLARVLQVAGDFPRITIAELDQAVRHIKCHVPTNEINALIRKWGVK